MDYNLFGAKVLVTGGAGLLGSHIVDKLIQRGALVSVLDDFSEGHRDNLPGYGPTVICADIAQPDSLKGWHYDFIFHCAGHLLQKAQANHRGAIDTNILGTYNLCEAALKYNAEKVVFTSSISIYGSPRYLPVDESHPWDGDTIYGMTKVAGELILRDFACRGLKHSLIRPANIYGPRQSPKNGSYSQVIPLWLRAITAGQPIVVYGDGSQTLDAVFVEDMAEAHIRAMEVQAADGEAFNIGSGISTSAIELAERLRIEMGVPNHPIEFVDHDVSRVKQRGTNIKKARQLLDWEPQYDLANGLRETCRWWKERNVQSHPS